MAAAMPSERAASALQSGGLPFFWGYMHVNGPAGRAAQKATQVILLCRHGGEKQNSSNRRDRLYCEWLPGLGSWRTCDRWPGAGRCSRPVDRLRLGRWTARPVVSTLYALFFRRESLDELPIAFAPSVFFFPYIILMATSLLS